MRIITISTPALSHGIPTSHASHPSSRSITSLLSPLPAQQQRRQRWPEHERSKTQLQRQNKQQQEQRQQRQQRQQTLHTSPFRRQTYVHPQGTNATTPSRPLYRRPERSLPTLESLSSTRLWLRTLPIFILIITGSALAIFNYQKVNSPLVAATLYSLRTNQRVRSLLGDEVYFASKWTWIWGSINLVQGKVNVTFSVKGTKDEGQCRFRAIRKGGKGGLWVTQEWSLTMSDGSQVDLLSHGEPLEGKTF